MARKTARRSEHTVGKNARLEARLTRAEKQIIERAAYIRGTSVTNFILSSAQQAANETIRDFEVLKLRGRAREVFVDALLNPPTPNAAARAAARRYKDQMGR